MATAVLQTSHVSSNFGKCAEESAELSQRISTQVKVECAGKVGRMPQLDYRLLQLASQHHASEYNRLKFGSAGSPMTYVPISLVMPEQVKELQERQACLAKQEAWYRAEKHTKSTHASLPASATAENRSHTHDAQHDYSPSATLQDELYAAMSDTMLPPTSTSAPVALQTSVKTSDSHPINVSMIIPFELLRVISAHLVERGDASPIMFELPPTHHLHRTVLQAPQDPPVRHAPPVPPTSIPQVPPLRPSNINLVKPNKLSQFLWSTPSIRRAFHSAIGTGNTNGHAKRARPRSMVTPPMGPGGSSVIKPQPLPTLPTVAYTSFEGKIEKQIAGILRPQSVPPSGEKQQPPLGRSRTDLAFLRPSSVSLLTDLRYSKDAELDTPARSTTPVPAVPVAPSLPKMIGNLFLSSCPGKKVRLDGPAKGRGGVCRDLKQDLLRFKDLGVACIVCCLDDEELDFLGVSWTKYAQQADELGIDMLRLPTPEGLAPLDPVVIDLHLTHLIKTYTLRGLPALIHCRGGVGRAGLLACCWLLKLGLCGWIEPASEAPAALNDIYRALSSSRPLTPVGRHATRADTMALVERAIAVVRRRRGAKAIETYEQVRFLVDFVELLRAADAGCAIRADGESEAAASCDAQID